MTKVVNIFGAPGVGKSTLAAKLFALMKESYMSVELVTEYAKDLHYDGVKNEDYDQSIVFAEQHKRVKRLIGKVDFVITDSPLVLSAFYSLKTDYPTSFADFALELSQRYDNINLLVKRNHQYDPSGRFQDEAGSDAIHTELELYLNENHVKYKTVLAGGQLAHDTFYEIRNKSVYFN
jgi:nicotinamide riboside kinase